jgi:hypothetical protein
VFFLGLIISKNYPPLSPTDKAAVALLAEFDIVAGLKGRKIHLSNILAEKQDKKYW